MEALAISPSPTQAAQSSRFWSRGYQQRFLGTFARQERKRFLVVWHRRAGKDDCMLNALIQHIAREEAAGRIGAYWYVFPEMEETKRGIWTNICGHNIRQIEHVPEDLRAGPDWAPESEKALRFAGGSLIQFMGGKFPNRLRGPNPRGIVFSEWAQMNPGAWDVVEPILAENGGWAVFNTTPYGNNHAARMWRQACSDPAEWFTDLRTVDDTRRDSLSDQDTYDKRGEPLFGRPVIAPAAIEQMRREGKSEEFLLQEYWCSWSGVMTGSFFGLAIEQARKEGRVTAGVRHEPQLPVETFWDLGWRHALVVWFVQKLGRERRIIDCHAQIQGSLADAFAALGQGPRKGYNYARHWVPHDAKVHELGTGKARIELFKVALGERKIELVPDIGFGSGIEAVNNVLPRCYFNAALERPLDALVSYHREYDELRGIYGTRPYEDWTCDYADAFRMFAVAEKDDPKAKPKTGSGAARPSSAFSV